ncbi:MAG: phage tail protein [Desulfovibrio sp.]|nr:phage tail protein [Desulfovibrio sp.]
MSAFWKYFHDRLNWSLIFNPGSVSAIVKGLALEFDRTREDIVWLRRQWTPITCEENRVALFGDSRGVPRTRSDTDATYKNRVINAYRWHKLGGKIRGVEKIYLENDFITKILNASDPELWAHFRVWIDVNNTVFGPDAAELSWFLANEYKPGRSKIEYFITSINLDLEEYVGVGVTGLSSLRSHIYFPPPSPPEMNARLGVGVGGVTSAVYKLSGYAPPASDNTKLSVVTRTSFQIGTQ